MSPFYEGFQLGMARCGVFVAVQAFFASIAWLGGYNFDSRGVWVAYVAFFSVVLGALAALFIDAPHDRTGD